MKGGSEEDRPTCQTEVLGVNKTKPSADCGQPLRIPKLHLLQRMVLCLHAQMRTRMYFLHASGGPCAPSVAVSCPLPEIQGLDEEMKNVLKNSTRKTE